MCKRPLTAALSSGSVTLLGHRGLPVQPSSCSCRSLCLVNYVYVYICVMGASTSETWMGMCQKKMCRIKAFIHSLYDSLSTVSMRRTFIK